MLFQPKLMVVFAVLAIIFSSSPVRASGTFNLSQALEAGDTQYGNNECEKAIDTYGTILSHASTSSTDYSLALFRQSYCEYSLDQTDKAEEGFRQLVSKHEGDMAFDEARLRLSESLLKNEKYQEAFDESKKIKDKDYLVDTIFVRVEALLELENGVDAFSELKKLETVPPESKALYNYWAGKVSYELGKRRTARGYFVKARDFSEEDSWIKDAAKSWVEDIDRELHFAHGQVVLGYLTDGNVGQSGTQVVSTYGVPEPVDASKSTSFITDQGYWVSLDMGLSFIDEHPWNLDMNLDFSSPYYHVNKYYDNQNISAELALSKRNTEHFVAGISAKYLDTRYYNLYYQDYLVFNLNFSWLVEPGISYKLEFPITQAIRSRHTTQVGSELTGKFRLANWATMNANVSVSKAFATSAVYANEDPSFVSDGTSFSNFITLGSYFSLSFYLPARLSLNALVSEYYTAFATEAVPLIATNNIALGDRQDSLLTYSLELTWDMIPHLSTLGVRYSHATNTSTGFQGLPSGYYMSNYNFGRDYLLVSDSLSF